MTRRAEMKKILIVTAMLGCAALFAAPDQPGLNRDYWTSAQHKGDRNAKSLVAKKVAPTGSDVQKTSEAKSWTKPEKNANWANDYVQRMYGFIVPDVSGDYVFYVAGDDSATLFLSTDETPAKAKAIARTSAWTNPKQFTKSPSQKSAPVKLEKGKKYYVEAVMFEGAGGDNLSFAWVVPGKNAPEIISEKNLKTMK